VNMKMNYVVYGSKEKHTEIIMRILIEKVSRLCGDSSFQVHLCYNCYFSCLYYCLKITSSGCGDLFPQWIISGRRSAHRAT